MAESAETHVVMLISSGQGVDTQWFDYRPGFYQPITRVEWDQGTMSVVLPSDVAGYLLKQGYARLMTPLELEEYTAPPPLAEETKSSKGNGS